MCEREKGEGDRKREGGTEGGGERGGGGGGREGGREGGGEGGRGEMGYGEEVRE